MTCWKKLVRRIPPPRGDLMRRCKALIIDSWFDNYVGVISLVRDRGRPLCTRRDKIRVMSTGRGFQVEKLGVFTPKQEDRELLQAGDVGFVIAGIKEIDGAPVGDTLTLRRQPG